MLWHFEPFSGKKKIIEIPSRKDECFYLGRTHVDVMFSQEISAFPFHILNTRIIMILLNIFPSVIISTSYAFL